MTVFYTHLASPWGSLMVISNGQHLTGLYFTGEGHCPAILPAWIESGGADPFSTVMEQLNRYFDGELKEFTLPLLTHGTSFQEKVWQALARIPYGQTISYTQLTYRIGYPRRARAVGQANGRNPISIILPCHRVIGSDGSLTGYGGGLDRKRAILEFEANH